MKVTVKLGAKADGTLTAFAFRNVSNTGAYGNHGGELFAAGAAIAFYRCPNKKFDAKAVYTNTVPSAALRGNGMTQPAFAVESAIHELAVKLDMDPLQLRRRNVVRPGDALLAIDDHPDNVAFCEDGVNQCIDLVDEALRLNDSGPDRGADWLIGNGAATSLHETATPTDHISTAWATLRDDSVYEIAVGTVEFGEGTSTAHVQIAATQLGTTPSRIHLVQADTDRTGFDTGAFASAGLFEARKAYGSPHSVTSNTHGFRIAVHRITGEIRILYSVQACDSGAVINPAQVRGQVEGGVAMGIGFTLTENFRVDDHGVMANPNLRNYRIPTYADIPRTEVILVKSTDSVGPVRSKGMAECCINPVAPALANALEDATGVRYHSLPLSPERIYDRLTAGRLIPAN